jgi:Protein of unknown function (DUF1501)
MSTDSIPRTTRRGFFSSIVDGLHGTALACLLGNDLFHPDPVLAAAAPRIHDLKPKPAHHPAKAKAVIQLFMNGGPSQVDLFDYKPALEKHAGQAPSRDLTSEVRAVRDAGGLMPSPFKFARHGQAGTEVSELLPHIARHVDDMAVIRSMYTTHLAHEAALFIIHSGRMLPGRPSLGAWIVYGLGSENQDLPAYVVLDDAKGLPINGIQSWQAGYLPGVYQGTRVRSEGAPLLNLQPSEPPPSPVVERTRSLLQRMDAAHRAQRPNQPDLDARIAAYELAARMQLEATDALDISKESEVTREMYGLNHELTASYGKRCLMARRLVERGVRLVQIYIETQIWDNHSNIVKDLQYSCGKTDKPIGALLSDLKQRGLLDSTLVVWGGEFGRLPIAQSPGANVGRDHGPSGFTVWFAGGGVKGGTVYGATDEIGYKAVENRVSVHDFHATILHLAGLNHRDLFFERDGRHERVTDEFPARVVREILA